MSRENVDLPINDAVPSPTQIQPGNLFLWNWTAMQEYARTCIAKNCEWLPIEAAPMDGTEIDVWSDGRRYPDAAWTRPDGAPADYEAWCFLDAEVYGCDVSWPITEIKPEPTHWMHKPAPPSNA